MKLTAQTCQTSKSKTKPYKLTDGRGLFLLVKADGGKYWRYNYRFAGKQYTLSLGVYPEISLAEAREKHRVAHKSVSEGQNPNQIKKQVKQQIRADGANTFKAIAKEWLENKSEEWTAEYCKTIEGRLEKDLFPKLGNLPIKTIDAPILLDALKAIEKRGVFETTKRARQYCSQILRYAIATGRSDRDYTVDIKGALKSARVNHHSALDTKDLPEFLRKLDRNEARLFPQTIIAIRLLLLTFVRTNELIEAVWDEFDLKKQVWVIPAERMKMRKAHIVPLSKQVIKLLSILKETGGQWQYVLPGQNSPRKPMSNNTILYALYRLGYKGKATGHGFRALAMTTIKEQLDYRHEVIDRQLAHAHRNSVDAAYDRAQFLKDRAIMMQDWADYIDSLIR